MNKPITTVLCILFFSFLVSCSSTQCKRKNKVPAMPDSSKIDKDLKIKESGVKPKTVYVYKNDGSLQCGMGQSIPLSEMSQELGEIKVYSSSNKHDGMMHIQVCGSSTGRINVFEIAESDLKLALSRGFKTWQF